MIAKSPTGAIQLAMYERVRDDPGSVDIYDYTPEQAKRPYIVFGNAITTPDNTHSGFGWRTVVSLEIWAEERGFKEIDNIKNRLIGLFDHQQMALDGFHVVVVKHEFDQNLRDPNPRLRRANLRFIVETEQDRE